jgi:hypothetical protein
VKQVEQPKAIEKKNKTTFFSIYLLKRAKAEVQAKKEEKII